MTRDEKIAKLGKKITDRAAVLLGKEKLTETSPEFWGVSAGIDVGTTCWTCCSAWTSASR